MTHKAIITVTIADGIVQLDLEPKDAANEAVLYAAIILRAVASEAEDKSRLISAMCVHGCPDTQECPKCNHAIAHGAVPVAQRGSQA